jgi:hypothetical protein
MPYWLALLSTLSLAAVGTAPPVRPDAAIWHNPGNVRALDLAWGPGGKAHRPRPPFRFIEEDMSGTAPKIKVRDADGVTWSVKWGKEAWTSPFSTHFVWACGYFVETEYFIDRGRIDGAHDLHRAAQYISDEGTFRAARFQLRSKYPRFVTEYNWSWVNNPFQGTHEFNGLRILMMLLSNWDAKDARDIDRSMNSKTADSNVGLFEQPGRRPRYLYIVSDWGATMGRDSWIGGRRGKWEAKKYNAQTANFVRGVRGDGVVDFGFNGTHGKDVERDITVSDVRWLLRYLGRISDAQIRRDLESSGATDEQITYFAPALRERIRQLQDVAQARF